MRLIDADELIETGSKIKIKVKNNCNPYEAIRIQGNEFRKAVENAPTIDAEPVKPGRWIRHLGNVECSECLNRYSYLGEANYCPNCGAKMDGGNGNG